MANGYKQIPVNKTILFITGCQIKTYYIHLIISFMTRTEFELNLILYKWIDDRELPC